MYVAYISTKKRKRASILGYSKLVKTCVGLHLLAPIFLMVSMQHYYTINAMTKLWKYIQLDMVVH